MQRPSRGGLLAEYIFIPYRLTTLFKTRKCCCSNNMKILFWFILLFFSFKGFAQEANLSELVNRYESLEYGKVIELSQKLLRSNADINENDKIDILTMYAISFYAIGQIDSSREIFIDLLNIKNNYELNPSKVSPKIIGFFEQIKKDYKSILNGIPDDQHNEGTNLKLSDMEIRIVERDLFKQATLKSIVLPGWGHLTIDDGKGWWLTSASTALLGSMLYFVFDANSKENDYLNQTNPLLIAQKYDDYNQSYKIRNTLIISYAVIWLYSQIDILFFSDDAVSRKINKLLQTNYLSANPAAIEVTFQINF
jgi:hypothetical protein